MRRPERERVLAVGLGAVLLVLLAAGPAPAQPAVTLRFTGGELGFGVQGSQNGFPGNRQSAEARYREWLKLPLSGSLLDPRFLGFSAVLRPTLHQGTSNRGAGTVEGRDLDFDASARLFSGRPVSFLATRAWASGLSERAGSRLSDHTSSSTTGTMRLQYRPLPMTLSYSERSVDQAWFAIRGHAPLRQMYDTRALRLSASNSRTNIRIERTQFTDLDGGAEYASWSGQHAHSLTWGKGSQLRSSLNHAERTNHSSHRRLSWEEHLKLQHLRTLSTTWMYRRFASRDDLQSGRSAHLGFGVQHRPSPWIGWTLRLDERTNRALDGRTVFRSAGPGLSFTTPWDAGPRLSGGVSAEYETRDGEGGLVRPVTVVEEPHVVDGTRTFALAAANVDSATIVVRNDDLSLVYERGIDYEVAMAGGFAQIVVPLTSRIQPGDTVRIDYRYSVADSPREETLTTHYSLAGTWHGVWVRHSQSTRGRLNDAPEGVFGPTDFDDMATRLEIDRRVFSGHLRVDAARRRRTSSTVDQTVHEARIAFTPRATRGVSSTVATSWSRSSGVDLDLTTLASSAMACWTATPTLYLQGHLDVMSVSRTDGPDQHSLGGGVDARWRLGSLETTARYDHLRRHDGTGVTENRYSLRMVRRF